MTMMPMPMSWMSSSGMNPKMSKEPTLCRPCAAYMKSAKKAASATAMKVPTNGRVYIVRARPVRS